MFRWIVEEKSATSTMPSLDLVAINIIIIDVLSAIASMLIEKMERLLYF